MDNGMKGPSRNRDTVLVPLVGTILGQKYSHIIFNDF
jgi:hypothetical protein